MAQPYSSIPFDARKLSITLFLADFLCYATRAEQQNNSLFAYIENSLQWLDGCNASFANFHLVFLMRLTRFVGFFPNIDDYREGDCFDLNYDSMHLFRMSHDDRNRIIDVLLHYYRLHVPNFPELRSLAVLKQLWAQE